jgi:hypothetical protein
LGTIEIIGEDVGQLERSQCIGVERLAVSVDAFLPDGVDKIPRLLFVETKLAAPHGELDLHA